RQEEDQPTERGVKKQGQQIRARERRRTKESGRHYRGFVTRFHQRESRERRKTDDETRHHRRSSQTARIGFDQTEDETAQSNGRQHRAQPIHAAGRLFVAAFRDSTPHDQQHDGGERDVDEKDPSPRKSLDQPAPQYGADPGGNRRETRPCSDGPATPLLAEVGADERQTSRYQKRGAHALRRARDDQARYTRRQPAPDGRKREKHD